MLSARGGVQMELVSLASSLDALVFAELDSTGVVDGLRTTTRLRRLLDACDIQLNRRLVELADDDPAISPEHTNAEATQRSLRRGSDSVERARRAGAVPVLEQAVANGDISAEHLDVFVGALRSLDEALRWRLLELQAELVRIAAASRVEEFGRRVRAEVRTIEADDGTSRLVRQKKDTGLKTWTGRDGMWNIHGIFDPETALPLIEALRRATETLFHGEHPEGAPEDPLLRHHWFQAHALARLMRGEGAVSGAPEFVIVMDHETFSTGKRHPDSRVECGCEVEIPIETLLNLGGRARFVPVIVDADGNVISEGARVPSSEQLVDALLNPVDLDRGREVRHADRKQRHALRAMYRHCAIPGCRVPFARCEIHHIRRWEDGGPTDLGNLLPVCSHHHDRIHADGWMLELGAARSLVIRKQGAIIMSTGPPGEQWAA